MADSNATPLTRQQLYDRIRNSSKDAVVLAEMQRLGFWPTNASQPQAPERLIHRQTALEVELRELLARQQRMKDPAKALQEMHKARKQQALLTREETKRKHAETQAAKALAWQQRNQQGITYLGDCGSVSLQNTATDTTRLHTFGLPIIENHLSLAQAMGISLSELCFLAYSRQVSTVSHYKQFKVAKKSGGYRLISAPMPRLKRAQYWILANILEKIPVTEQAHGFVRGRSIVTNAQQHSHSKVVINVDLKDFFPTIDYRRVKGVFVSLGYSEALAAVFALLTTSAETERVTLDGEAFHIAQGERRLPQGAPSSPALTNILCWKLDKRLQGAAHALGFEYSRYADDLTFSSKSAEKDAASKLLWRVRQIVNAEGFKVHPDKTRVMYRHKRQEVTGVVVNEKPSIERKELKKFRALLFQIEKSGPTGKHWGNAPLFPAIDGYANYVAMVNPEKGIPLQQKVARLKRQYGYTVKPWRIQTLNRKLFKLKAAQGEAPRDGWWTPAAPAAPLLLKTDLQRKEERKRQRNNAATEDARDGALSVSMAPANPVVPDQSTTQSSNQQNIDRRRVDKANHDKTGADKTISGKASVDKKGPPKQSHYTTILMVAVAIVIIVLKLLSMQ